MKKQLTAAHRTWMELKRELGGSDSSGFISRVSDVNGRTAAQIAHNAMLDISTCISMARDDIDMVSQGDEEYRAYIVDAVHALYVFRNSLALPGKAGLLNVKPRQAEFINRVSKIADPAFAKQMFKDLNSIEKSLMDAVSVFDTI